MATKNEIAQAIAAQTGLSQTEARKVLDAVVETISDELAAGGEVSVPGFGKFSVSHRAARQGRNPATGASIQVAASKAAKFSAASSLKKRLNAGGSGGEPDEYQAEGLPGEYQAEGLPGDPDE